MKGGNPLLNALVQHSPMGKAALKVANKAGFGDVVDAVQKGDFRSAAQTLGDNAAVQKGLEAMGSAATASQPQATGTAQQPTVKGNADQGKPDGGPGPVSEAVNGAAKLNLPTSGRNALGAQFL
jgi:hypothetical protein